MSDTIDQTGNEAPKETEEQASGANVATTAGGGGFCPMWESPSGIMKKFHEAYIPKLKLKKSPLCEYVVYENEENFKVVEAKTVIEAISASEIEVPERIVHGGSRLATIIEFEKLERCAEDASEGVVEGEAGDAAPAEGV